MRLHLPTANSQIVGPTILVITMVMLYLPNWLSDYPVQALLRFNQQAISEGEFWRLLTGNLLHTNHWHLILNIGGVVLLWAIHGYYYRTKPYLFGLLTAGLFTCICIYLFSPQLKFYVGMSGALHGLFVWGAYMDIKHKYKTGWLLMIGVWLKILHEQFSGASAQVASLIESQVAIDSHLYGGIAGLVLVLYCMIKMNKA